MQFIESPEQLMILRGIDKQGHQTTQAILGPDDELYQSIQKMYQDYPQTSLVETYEVARGNKPTSKYTYEEVLRVVE